MRAVVGGDEIVIGREASLTVSAGELDRAGVAGSDITVSIVKRDAEVVGCPRRDG